MERPKLRYAYNEALINTYAEELEKYCDELEKISSTLSKSFSESMFKIYQLNKALDKACELLVEAVSQDCTIFDEVIEEEYMWRTEIDDWKEWCIKNG